MKTILIILTFLFLLSCDTSKTIHVSVLDDHTEDTKPVLFELYHVISHYGEDIYEGKSFSYRPITDVIHSKVFNLNLPVENPLLSNSIDRKAKVKKYYETLQKQFDHSDLSNWGYEISPIWESIVNEISRVKHMTTAQKRILILRSDLRQNSVLYNSYKDNDLPNVQIVYRFLKWAKEKGVTKEDNHPKLIIYHSPKDRKSDKEFSKLSSVYQSVCDSLNIPLEFKYQ